MDMNPDEARAIAMGRLVGDRDRFRDALTMLAEASVLTGRMVDQANPLAIFLTEDGDLNWSAVHTFTGSVLGDGMTAPAALADLTGSPICVQEQPQDLPTGATDVYVPPQPLPPL